MTFLGLALVCVAVGIWRWMGRRPVLLRTLDNGDRVLGPPSIATRPDLPHDAPHVRRIAREPAPEDRLGDVRPGTHLELRRVGDHWIVADQDGPIAHVGRAGADLDMPGDVLAAAISNLPEHGRLRVDRVLQDRAGRTIDLRGVVEVPNGSPDGTIEAT